MNTPIFEENPEKFQNIDIMRAVRSFDPCHPRAGCTCTRQGQGAEEGALASTLNHEERAEATDG
jgi:hypothetical protein